jgi:cytochrome c-type biogenesis protein CcmH
VSLDAWLGAAAIVVIVLVTAFLAWSLGARRRRARDLAPLTKQIESSRARLGELRRQLDAGEISQELVDQEQRSLTAALLQATEATAAPRGLPTPAFVGGTVLLAAVAGFSVHSYLGRAPDRPAMAADAQAPGASAATAKAEDKPARTLSDEQLERMVEQSTALVKKTPGDAASWAMLAHSYDMLGKFAESSKAYATLARLLPKDAQVLADYADALAVANGRTLAGEPTLLVKKALALDGRNLKALALAGSAAFERKDTDEAIGYWQRALAASPDPAFRAQIESSIAEARAASGGEAASAPVAEAPAAAGASAPPGGAVVAGRVSLADDLVAKAPPEATVFIFARPAQGSRMPVALVRKKVRDLPFEFSLDDSNAMVRDVKMSQVRTVVIGARVSLRGDVTPKPGDMQGWSAPVPVGTHGMRLEISEVLK